MQESEKYDISSLLVSSLQQEDGQEGFISAFPLEMWLRIFRFLDVYSLGVRVPLVCKMFFNISNWETLWKRKCNQHFPKPTCTLYHPERGWKSLFKDVYCINVEGKRQNFMSFARHLHTHHEEGEQPQIFEPSNMINTEIFYAKRASKNVSCDVLTGEGSAPWGTFIIISCGYGNFYNFSHIYSEFPGIFSNYFGEVTLKSNEVVPLPEVEWMKGFWNTTWQDSCGSWVSFDVFNHGQYSAEATTIYKESNIKSSSEDLILGAWEGLIRLDNSINEEPIKFTFHISGCAYKAFKGHLVRQDYFKELRSSSIRGVVKRDMISFTLNGQKGSSRFIFVVVCQMLNSTILEGKVVTCSEKGENIRPGSIVVHRAKVTKKEGVHHVHK